MTETTLTFPVTRENIESSSDELKRLYFAHYAEHFGAPLSESLHTCYMVEAVTDSFKSPASVYMFHWSLVLITHGPERATAYMAKVDSTSLLEADPDEQNAMVHLASLAPDGLIITREIVKAVGLGLEIRKAAHSALYKTAEIAGLDIKTFSALLLRVIADEDKS